MPTIPFACIQIIVPTLNTFSLLPHLVQSLQHQTWPHWHLMFIDGPSSPEHRIWLENCCLAESRCNWVHQDSDRPGIFGAMNQGFAAVAPSDWLVFWGSDDWAASPTVLAEAMETLFLTAMASGIPDLLVCSGRYANAYNGVLGRLTTFSSGSNYRRALLLGSTPPHQATLIGPGARARLARYADGFKLSADLDYFLQLSRFSDLRVQSLDLELVHMSSGGISGQQTQRRLQEVRKAYQRAFGWFWWFPFIARYVRRIFSLLGARC